MTEKQIDFFIKEAIKECEKGVNSSDGGPFGAVIVNNEEIISRAHNTVIRDNDPTCHAEVNAIRNASVKLGTYNLSKAFLFSTAEPCTMCYSSAGWAGIKNIYFVLKNEDIAALGFDEYGFFDKNPERFKELNIIELNTYKAECIEIINKWKLKDGKIY